MLDPTSRRRSLVAAGVVCWISITGIVIVGFRTG